MSIVGRVLGRIKRNGLGEVLVYSARVAHNHVKDALLDLRYAGRLLPDENASPRRVHRYALDPDATPSAHTPVYKLEEVFALEPIRDNDVVCDIGCGDGRVIAWWLSQGVKNTIFGLEIDPQTAAATQRRFAKYDNVRIMHADATKMLPVATLFYLNNPFRGAMIRRFVELFAQQPHARAIFVNYNDLPLFEDGRFDIELKKGTRDDRQFRAAIIRPRRVTSFASARSPSSGPSASSGAS